MAIVLGTAVLMPAAAGERPLFISVGPIARGRRSAGSSSAPTIARNATPGRWKPRDVVLTANGLADLTHINEWVNDTCSR